MFSFVASRNDLFFSEMLLSEQESLLFLSSELFNKPAAAAGFPTNA